MDLLYYFYSFYKHFIVSIDIREMRIAFVHPDLGIGGAERLVVDAAMGLKKLGHKVDIFTSHHDIHHCFEETISNLFFIME